MQVFLDDINIEIATYIFYQIYYFGTRPNAASTYVHKFNIILII